MQRFTETDEIATFYKHQKEETKRIEDSVRQYRELLERDRALAPDHFHCFKCGKYLFSDFAFCPDCGQRICWETYRW